jgi:endonuclease YncB( thermonuclease family)
MSRSWPGGSRQRYPRQRRSLRRKLVDYGLTAALFLLLAFLVVRFDERDRRSEAGMAIVNDGDTITLGHTRIRLRGIDAPEYTQLCSRDGGDYACGKLARQALASLIAGRPVSCDGSRLDRYGRLLGDCRVGDLDLNRRLVSDGWAVAYGGFEREEAAARAGRRGIWAGGFERPQDWRRQHQRAETASEMHDHAQPSLLVWLSELFRFR